MHHYRRVCYSIMHIELSNLVHFTEKKRVMYMYTDSGIMVVIMLCLYLGNVQYTVSLRSVSVFV